MLKSDTGKMISLEIMSNKIVLMSGGGGELIDMEHSPRMLLYYEYFINWSKSRVKLVPSDKTVDRSVSFTIETNGVRLTEWTKMLQPTI